MSPRNKKLLPGLLSGLLLSASLIPAAINNNSYASGSSSFFDWKAEACVIENYNAENGTSVSSIEDVDFEKITTLDCADRGIKNIRGLVLMKNLENLILFKTDFYLDDAILSALPKLKTLDIHSNSQAYFDVSHNPDLETIITNRNLYLTTSAYVEKTDDGYGMDLSSLKFLSSSELDIDQTTYPSTYDATNKFLSFEDKVPDYYEFGFKNTNFDDEEVVYHINTRSGYMRYEIFLEGDEEVETHNPFYVNHDCEKRSDDYGSWYSCDNSVYAGEELDTDKIIDNTLKKIFNLDDYELSEVKIVPPTANIELTKDEDTLKQGTILPEASFTLEFHFELKKPKAPDTGFFTNRDGSVNVSNVLLALAGLSISAFTIIFLAHRLSKKAKAKRF